ncbi:hypothetical protein LTR28_009227 [Elasticomyces elasticus]|nr:hypothetical protein LTR28_009227 [Elasticomyces elasticus]
MDSYSPSADLRRHTVFGNFNMNMGLATSDQSRLPTVSKTEIGATQKGSPRVDHDYAILVHAIVMCVAFVLIMPFGVVLLRVLETVRWHAWNQALAALLVVLGTAIGIYWSGTYNRSKKYNSAHQIIGIILVVAVIIQLSLGFFHHRYYKKHARPTLMGRIHRYLGPAVLFFGIVNGGTGLDFTGNATAGYVAAYVVVVVVVALLVGGAIFMKMRQQRRKKASTGGDEGGFYRVQGNGNEGSNIGLKPLSRD